MGTFWCHYMHALMATTKVKLSSKVPKKWMMANLLREALMVDLHVLEYEEIIRSLDNVKFVQLSIMVRKVGNMGYVRLHYRTPLHEQCPKHHGHKGDPTVTPITCGAVGERAQVILVWVRARALEMPPIHGNLKVWG